jgi:exonuclease V
MSTVNSNETHQVPPQQTTQESFEGAKSPNSDDDYNFPELTEQEFAQLDAVFNQHLNKTLGATEIDPLCQASDNPTSDKPQVVIEYEAAAASSAKLTHKQAHLGQPAKYHNVSPFDKHRSWKLLSVSDLVAPAWYVIFLSSIYHLHKWMGRCELQFDYGLRQKRYKKLEDRPASFISGKGKTVVVAEATAKRNDRTLKGGRVSFSVQLSSLLS